MKGRRLASNFSWRPNLGATSTSKSNCLRMKAQEIDSPAQTTPQKQITILGGGPAGLAVGYYAKQHGIPFRLYEASNQLGGNCRTLRHQGFSFDLGAHRLHDKNPEITAEIKTLMGQTLEKIQAPSQIYFQGKFIAFPLSPLNLLANLGFYTSIQAGVELVYSRLFTQAKKECFEDLALKKYGKTIANRYLLNYSEKLWGIPCTQLSPNAAGSRLKGLDLKTFLLEALKGKQEKVTHLDGTFYYPKQGIGAIADKLTEVCGEETLVRNAKITRIYHHNSKIQALEINQGQQVKVTEVVNTLPLPVFLRMMSPSAPKALLEIAQGLRFQDLILVVVFLNKASVTPNASTYFPESRFLFSRVYEPRNRSRAMAPAGMTSLVAEVPCQRGSQLWALTDRQLIQKVLDQLMQVGWLQPEEILETLCQRIHYAYPILETGYEEKTQQIHDFLKGFSNLKISGRNGKFLYTHLHDMMGFGKEIIQAYCQDEPAMTGHRSERSVPQVKTIAAIR